LQRLQRFVLRFTFASPGRAGGAIDSTLTLAMRADLPFRDPVAYDIGADYRADGLVAGGP